MEWFQSKGYEIHVASNGEYKESIPFCDKFINIGIERSPYCLKNIGAYKKLKKVIDVENYKIIHLNTPMGGVIGRFAARKSRKKGAKVIYTAHGFYFYKGASFFNWIVYYNIERYLSRYTDAIITMNKEDFLAAKKCFFTKSVYNIHGMGVDTDKFKPIKDKERYEIRYTYGYNEDDFILLSVAEMCKRKDPLFIVNNAVELKRRIPKLKILFVGKGYLEETVKMKIKELDLDDTVKVLGYRSDVPKLLQIADILISASKMEGLPVNIIEALFSGTPVVVSDIRGQNDLISNGKNGFLFNLKDNNGFINAIEKIYKDPELKIKLSQNAVLSTKKYSIINTLEEMACIYKKYI